MYLLFLILALIISFFIQPYERCNPPRVYDNLQVKSCFHRTAFNIKYSTEYSDARWVFRYKISKSIDNIEQIKRICN